MQAVLGALVDRLAAGGRNRSCRPPPSWAWTMPLSLLQAVAEAPEASLRLGLTHLQAAEFLYENAPLPEIAYLQRPDPAGGL